jgi:hypothetical protein
VPPLTNQINDGCTTLYFASLLGHSDVCSHLIGAWYRQSTSDLVMVHWHLFMIAFNKKAILMWPLCTLFPRTDMFNVVHHWLVRGANVLTRQRMMNI